MDEKREQTTKRINELFSINDLRAVIQEAAEPVRDYKKQSEYIYKPEAARMKAVIYYKNGLKRYYYSYDTRYFNKQPFQDEFEGMKKLIRLIQQKQGQYKNAIIYASIDELKGVLNADYNYQVVYFNQYGNMYTNPAVRFAIDGKDNVLHLKHLEMYGKKIINV